MRKSGLIYPLLLLVCWTGLVAAGTYALISTTIQQELALGYANVKGKIVLSQVGLGPISRRGLDMEYNYVINGVEYTGHRFRYDDHNASFEWDSMVEDHPRWSRQTIYYDPKNPADSLLVPGIDGGDCLLVIFAIPVLILTVTLWHGMYLRITEQRKMRPAGGVLILNRHGLVEAHLNEMSAVAAGFYALGGSAFVAAFPVAIFFGFNPSIHLMLVVDLLVLATGLGGGIWRASRNASGLYNLKINKTERTVTLPLTVERKKVVAISQAEIAGVSLCRRVSKGPSGLRFSYLPALKHTGEDAPSLKLVDWGWSEEKAQAFARWLSEELGARFLGVEDESAFVVSQG